MSGNDGKYAQAVTRACEIVKAFRHEGEELVLSDVTERTGLSRTTSFRLLQSLVYGGLLENTARGVYRCSVPPSPGKRFRPGFAAQTDSEFSRGVAESLQRAAAREHVDLITVNNRHSAKEALRNTDVLIRERVDRVLEFQTYERAAPVIASKFLEARIPVIAIEIPYPGATFFGANNYQAGVIGGRALGRWAKEHWEGEVEQILILGLPIAGPLPGLRITGAVDGLREQLPRAKTAPVIQLDGRAISIRSLVNDTCALATLRAFEEAGSGNLCAVVGQNAILDARNELRRPGTRLIGTVAYFPERYGDELLPLAFNLLRRQAGPTGHLRQAPIAYAEKRQSCLRLRSARRAGRRRQSDAFEHANVGQRAEILGVVEPVAHDELIRNPEAGVGHIHRALASVRLGEQRRDAHRTRFTLRQQVAQIAERDATVDNVFHHEHVAAFDRQVEVPGELHFAGRGVVFAVARDADKIDAHRRRDGASEVGEEEAASLQDADQIKRPLRIVGADLRAHLGHAPADVLLGDQDTPRFRHDAYGTTEGA